MDYILEMIIGKTVAAMREYGENGLRLLFTDGTACDVEGRECEWWEMSAEDLAAEKLASRPDWCRVRPN